ncbi:MAG: CinA family protein [Alphaproteobacteria bacterium]|nr:CinA family protein [Alphaproteobacteria bacterium]
MDALVARLFEKLKDKGCMIATAESCTGGLIAAHITEIAGSSAYFDRGFVTYSNDAKTRQLGVPAALIEAHGAVSAEVAEAMAQGALEHSEADIAIAVTGIAGPTGGTPQKPVGLVYIGIATWDGAKAHEHHYTGGRTSIRQQTVTHALEYAIKALS